MSNKLNKETTAQNAIDNVVYILEMSYKWFPSRTIQRKLGISARDMRYIASMSGGRIISGNKGYKAACNADREELQHCIHRLRHQAVEMVNRANEIEYAFA